MVSTLAGTPAGYGYMTETSVAEQDVMPNVVSHIKQYDKTARVICIQHMTIQVETDCQVSINDKAPFLVQAENSVTFEVRGGVNSLTFNSAVKYNLIFTY